MRVGEWVVTGANEEAGEIRHMGRVVTRTPTPAENGFFTSQVGKGPSSTPLPGLSILTFRSSAMLATAFSIPGKQGIWPSAYIASKYSHFSKVLPPV